MTIRDVIGSLGRFPHWALALIARFGIAGVFWRSGQTKVQGWEVTGSAIALFADEYKVPVLPPEMAAHLAAAAEHALPLMLVLGLGTRLGAAGLLGMTLVIQVFVYPASWPDHLTWAAALAYILTRGPGCVSLDCLIAQRFLPR